ncbi:unnamed protein product [Dovyalis caffra]|uniref:Pentatricopeptide repeat-containing protein n=1 Tax=Dovyalis caffra TaxID=77055 RepID=A0AAV1SMV3_9ROSI|nr:unnamed protein product [Dovyalis caffra]
MLGLSHLDKAGDQSTYGHAPDGSGGSDKFLAFTIFGQNFPEAPYMKTGLLLDVVEGRDEESDFTALRQIFSSRLVDYFLKHPEACDIPQAILPGPFNKCNEAGDLSESTLRRAMPSSDDKQQATAGQKQTLSCKPAKRVLDFSYLEGSTLACQHVERSLGSSSIDQKTCHSGTTRLQMSIHLPDIVSLIHNIFQSVNFSPITKEELVHKIILGEVEEQIGILEKRVPDWICWIPAPSRDDQENVRLRHSSGNGYSLGQCIKTIQYSLLDTGADLGPLDHGQAIHGCISKVNLEEDLTVSNALMDYYSKGACLESAKKILNGLVKKDVFSWTTVILGHASHGKGNCALEMFYDMLESRVILNDVTLSLVLSGTWTWLKIEIAGKKTIELEPCGDGVCVLLRNKYNAANRIEDEQKMRKMMAD